MARAQVCSDVQGSLLAKWVHVAVVRGVTNTNGAVTYKVYVNGNVLETRTYPAGSRLQAAAAGDTYAYSLGETDQFTGPRTNFLNNDNFASNTALIFGSPLPSIASLFRSALEELVRCPIGPRTRGGVQGGADSDG